MADQAGVQHFFSPYEPPPDYCAAPPDSALAQRVCKLAQFAARNGPSFVELMRVKQTGNAEYHFLSGGEGAGYWRWILYCTVYNLPPGQASVLLHACPMASYACMQRHGHHLHGLQSSPTIPRSTPS